MASRAIWLKSSFALVVISPPTTTRLLLAYVSQATRLRGSCARQASSTASEMVSHTLSGWPSPTDSEEKMKFLLMYVFIVEYVLTYQDRMIYLNSPASTYFWKYLFTEGNEGNEEKNQDNYASPFPEGRWIEP